MIAYERFKLALSSVEGAQWRAFEVLATVFMADQYPSLRPMASASGDGGLDAQLWQPDDDVAVALQFSVRKDWETKIVETCKRLRSTHKDVKILVFASNQEIGPAANKLKKTVRSEFGVYLDVRDREWFLSNRNHGAASTAEAEEFAAKIVDPLLGDVSSMGRQAQALDDLEAKAAFVYLGLQWEDDTREKGLTKLCMEAMVRAVLRDTTSEQRMPRQQIHEQIKKLLPAQDRNSRAAQVDGALKRLSKVHIRHWTKVDEFCLTWAERIRLHERLAEMDALDVILRSELRTVVLRVASEDGVELVQGMTDEAVERARGALERVLLQRGEAFAEAVVNERGANLRFDEVEALVYADLATNVPRVVVEPRLVVAALLHVMSEPSEEVRRYLRSLADTYTLFAFMRETPDVQSAVVKIFSEGDIWLDTTVVLPLMAEDLLDESHRAHSAMLMAAREAGLNLFVTDGVLEELASHVHRSRGYFHSQEHGSPYGRTPFLLACFRLSGRPGADFEAWLETFCGKSRPEDDIADYLSDCFGIRVQNLAEFADLGDPVLRAQISEIWHEARDERDRRAIAAGGVALDAGTRSRLVAHDVENYLGTQMRRESKRERRSAFGFKTWWLTLDGAAFRVARILDDKMEGKPLPSPAISPDFMLHYLAIGPVRARLSRKTEEALPLMLNMSVLDAVPQDLLDLSDALRKELAGLPAHVVRRKIRDTLDEARLLLGAAARSGETGLTEEIKSRLLEEARSR
ncbi:hypothetical protein [Pedococcus sp. 5OH_020]|uniref:hypothetical protein n=1 Tax=Pedococcus sp. 5OH_020 TaxID=2989814 RepID=UPI0022E9DBC1|nr:hypothetical protein [Pedococcus sp. 5OH_020]